MPASNVLFLFTDQQRADTMAAYGNNVIQTPNLNRLGECSTVFERAYATQAICTPSRSTIMTGLYPHTTGCTQNNFPLREETKCIPEMLTPGKYVTGYYGKWHLGDEIFRQHGFDEWRSIEDQYRKYYSVGRDESTHSTYHDFLAESGFTPADGDFFTRAETCGYPESFSRPAYLAREACDFIKDNKNRPFLLYVNFLEPHFPLHSPRDGQYSPEEVTLPENYDAVPAENQPLKYRIYRQRYRSWGDHGEDLNSEEGWRRITTRYWGLCSLVDTHVGTILRQLEETGVADNTIVVFTSDHGDMLGSHRLLNKNFMLEEAIRVPLMIRLPGQREQKRVSAPVSQVDLVPTLLDLMDEPSPDHLQGFSLRRELESGEESRRPVFVEWCLGPGRDVGLKEGEPTPDFITHMASRKRALGAVTEPVRAVITADGWKYCYRPSGESELYNLREDPGERENLFVRESMGSLVSDLHEALRQWQLECGDSLPISA